MTTDCLIIGFNEFDFQKTVELIRGNDESSGGYRDANLAFVTVDGKEQRAMDVLNAANGWPENTYHNADFMWPVVMYLGSYLANHGFSFDYINLFQQGKDKLRQKLVQGDLRTVVITTTLYVVPQPIVEMISFIRKYNQDVKIIIGGPYISGQATMLDDDALCQLFSYLDGDFYVISAEGEGALGNLLQALKNDDDFACIDNIAYRKKGEFVLTQRSTESNSLEENSVDYSLFDAAEIGEFLSIRTAKSCPFSCAFCGFPDRAGKYTYLDLKSVEKELDAIADIGSVTTLTILDDTFNVPKKRFREIMRLMIDKKYGFKWNSFYRSDHGDAETIALMKQAGCEGVFLGVESGSDAMLERMNKKSRRKDYVEAIAQFRKHKIITHANLLIGFPGETEETVKETISFIEETKPDFFRAQLWYCDPITPIWQRKDELGIQDFGFNWTHNTMDYKAASKWVEHMFLSVQNSIWLPQQGFELWSLFYLQRKGLSLPQIKGFVGAFNDAVREKLLFPYEREASPELIKNLHRWGKIQNESELPKQGEFSPLYDPDVLEQKRLATVPCNDDEHEEFAF